MPPSVVLVTQAPPVHDWPPPHAVHADPAPPLPHCDTVSLVTQLPEPSQQPLQLAALQPELPEHAPFTQDWLAEQTLQVPPLFPQAAPVFDGVMQVPLGAQQPLAQLLGPHPPWELTHIPAEQVCCAEQLLQVPPPPPHAEPVVPGSQTPFPLQQPEQLPGPHVELLCEQADDRIIITARGSHASTRLDVTTHLP